MAVKLLAKATPAVSIGITEKGSPSNDVFVVELEEKFDGRSSAKGNAEQSFAETANGKDSEEAVVHFVPTE